MSIPTPTNPIIISIEGNIGSGKSTLLDKLKDEYKNDSSICFIQEPISIWNTIKDSSGITILEKYYDDQQRYAFPFQMMAYITRLSILRKALNNNYRIIFMERSIYTDSSVFAKMLYDDKKIEDIEYTIYTHWVKEFIDDIPDISFIYVRANPEVSNDRVIKRGRHGETIPLEYLKNCHNYHEEWLNTNNHNVLILDANSDINDTGIFDKWVKDINAFTNIKTNSYRIFH